MNIFGINIDDDKSKSLNGTLTSVDFTPNNGGLLGGIKSTAPDMWSVNAKVAEKYQKQGLNFNPKDYYSGSLDLQLAETQSNWAKFGNALAQTVVSEIGLGIVGGFAGVFDLLHMAATKGQLEYDDTLTSEIEKWRKTFRNEVAPIYSKPGSGFENGTDFGWWMQNIPSIASSLTLLIPSAAVSKGISVVGKTAMKATSAGIRKGSKAAVKWMRKADNIEDVSKFRKAITPTATTANRLNDAASLLTTAAISRTLENYQEAMQVFDEQTDNNIRDINLMSDDEYNKLVEAHSALLANQGVNTNNKNEVAKALAREAANTTFKLDYTNLVFDVLQLATIRNVGFKLFNNSKPNAKVKRLDTNAKKFAGNAKSVEDVKRLAKEQSRKRRAWDKAKDIGYDLGAFGLTQATEGIEEAINYIASQEGFSVGKTLLDITAQSDHPLVFTDRLLEYIKHPELYESAFWGVMGGIVFGGAMGAYSNRQLNKAASKDSKAKTDDKTGERTKGVKNFINSFWATPDLKRIETAIEHRFIVENNYKDKIELINKGVNPDTKKPIASEEERKRLIDSAIEERRTNLILTAMDSGTIGMLEGYLTDKNVQQALIDNQIMTKEKVDAMIQEDLKAIKDIEQIYNKEAKLINRASKNIYAKDGQMIPLDYLQIIARENIEKVITDNRYKKYLDEWNTKAQELEETLKDKLDPNINYKEMIILNRYVGILGELIAEKEELLKDKKTAESISGVIALQDLDRQIEDVKDKIVSLNEERRFGNLLYALEEAAKTVKNEQGEYYSIITPQSTKITDIINSKDLSKIKALDKRITNILSEDYNEDDLTVDLNKNADYKTSMINALSRASRTSIQNISSDLASLYAGLTDITYYSSLNRAKMYKTEEEIKTRASQIHNEMQEIRRAKINAALPLVMRLAKTYGAEKIQQAITDRFKNKPIDIASIGLSEDDAKTLLDTLDVLNLSSDLNKPIYATIDNILSNWDKIESAEKETKPNLNEDRSKDKKDSSTITSTEEQTSQNEEKMPQKEPISEHNNYESATKQLIEAVIANMKDVPTGTRTTIMINIDGQATIDCIKYQNDNTEHIILEFDSEETASTWFNNNDLFSQEDGVTISNNNFKIAKHPVIDTNGNIVEIGKLVNLTTPIEVTQSTYDDISSTGGVSSTPQPIISQIQTGTTGSVADINDTDNETQKEIEEEYLDQIISIATGNVANSIEDSIKENKEFDLDVYIESKKPNWEKRVNNKGDIEVIEQRVRNSAIRFMERKGVIPAQNVINVVAKLSKFTENPNDVAAKHAFYKSVDKVLKDLDKFITTIDGKRYVNIEALCRYCNDIIFNEESDTSTEVSKAIVTGLIDYAKDPTNDIVILDEDINKVEHNIRNKSRILNVLADNINIRFEETIANTDNKENIQKTVDTLNPNDPLDVSVESGVVLFKKDGIILGSLPAPKYINNSYVQDNDGWITDINLITHQSKLKDLFIEWLTNSNNDKDIAELNDIINQYIYNTDSNENLTKKLHNNKAFKKAIADGRVNIQSSSISNKFTKKHDTIDFLNGLAKIWKYANSNLIYDANTNNYIRTISINNWFDKVERSFNFINDVINGNSTEVLVDKISEGELIITKEQTDVQNAIGSNHKNDIRLGVALTNGEVTLAGDGINGVKTLSFNAKKGNTFIVIPSRSGNHGYVQAYPQRANSNTISDEMKAIKNDIKDAINSILNENIYTSSKVEKLEMFLRSILSVTDNNQRIRQNRLFKGAYKGVCYVLDNTIKDVKTNSRVKNGMSIAYKGVDDINIQYLNITPALLENKDNKAMAELSNYIMKIINDYCTFNISFDAINSNTTFDRNACRRDKDGSFIVDINGKIRKYSSYNAFMINNNLIKVTTKPSPDGKTNYIRNTNNQKTTQRITVKLVSVEKPPVEEIRDISSTNTNLLETIKSIINSSSETKGLDIANSLGFNFKDNTKFKGIVLNLFPKNVIFVKELGYGKNAPIAASNPHDEKAKISKDSNVLLEPGQVAIGPNWIDLANKKPAEAVRKLIHEQLHLHLADKNQKYIEQIREIYNDFINALNKESIEFQKHFENERFDDYKDANGLISTDGLEEFLIESLTNVKLANYLNDKQVDKVKGGGKKSILQKLMELINDLLGIKIKDGSIYQKEYRLLREMLDESVDTIKDEDKDKDGDKDKDSIKSKPIPEKEKSEKELTENDLNDNDLDFSRFEEDEYTPEMQAIKDKAIADGTFMKAPNGRASNLNERQWIHVRTKAFKEWFGDWEEGFSVKQDNKSYYRGQYEEPFIDDNGNLVLKGKKDSLYEKAGYNIEKGVSATIDMQTADEYGSNQRYAYEADVEDKYGEMDMSWEKEQEIIDIAEHGYYLIQFSKDIPNQVIKEVGEVKIVGDIIIPKGKYVIKHITDYDTKVISTADNTASKVVDENGEPLVVYHGSDSYGFDIFDPKISDDKRSLFFSGSKFIASTYTKFEPLRNKLIREHLIKNNAIELIKNKDYDALKTLIEEILDYNLSVPKDKDRTYDTRYSEYIDEMIYKLRKELLNSNLNENEIYGIQAEMSKLEDLMWFGKNYRLDITSHKFNDKEKIKLKIINNNEAEYSSIFREEGIIFNGTPEELIESILTKTKIYDIFLNIKNPLVLNNQIGEFGANNNWNRVEYKGKAYKTRDIAKIALEDGYDGVVFKDIIDRGPYSGDSALDPTTDRDIVNAYFHEFEDSYTGGNIYAADIFIAFDSNQVKSATDNIGTYSTENNNIKYSRITEGSTPTIDSFIDKFDLSERSKIIRQINDSEIEIQCK